MRSCIFVLAVIWISPTAVAQPASEAPSVSEWRQELDQIVSDIRSFHPSPFTRTGELAFLQEVEALKSTLPELSEEQRVVCAMRLVALMGDGHTQLEPNSRRFAFWYPFRLYEFTDGYFVTSAHPSARELAGAQVLEIAGRPAGEVAEEVRKLMGADNIFHRKEKLYALHNSALMKGLGYAGADGGLKIKAKLRDGTVIEKILTPQMADDPAFKGNESTFEWQFRGEMSGLPIGNSDQWISAYKNLPAEAYQTLDPSRPLHLACRRRCPLFARALPEQSAYYIQAYQVDDTNFVSFFQKSLEEVDRLKPRHLIVDLRYNFGGDGSQITAMIHEFIRREKNPPWTSLYILLGRKTFSAGVMAVAAFMDHVRCAFVGEPPGAPLNSYGDATLCRYPRIGLQMHVSTRRHQLSGSSDLSQFIPVDVPALFSFSDYAAGRDPAIDPILRGEEMRSVTAVALADGGSAARKIWLDRKRRFGHLSWWLPPREIDLRNACRALFEQKRTDDALETCKLTTEIHPYIWNSWFNLGYLYKQLGNEQAKLAAYRCVNEVDPSNHNAEAIRELLAAAGAEKIPPIEGCPVGRE